MSQGGSLKGTGTDLDMADVERLQGLEFFVMNFF